MKAIERIFIDDAGNPNWMVYVPPFKYKVGSVERILGGFWMDKYPCSHPNATATDRGTSTPNSPGTVGAVSQPRKVSWTGIDWNNAKVACQNRRFNGVSCHLTTPQEWFAVAILAKLNGTIPRGNNSFGKDIDFPWEVAEPDPYLPTESGKQPGSADYPYYGNMYARTLVGTGPATWAHNHDPSGIFDLCGTVWEWIDMQVVDGGLTIGGTEYLIFPTEGGRARINKVGGITATDTTIPYDSPIGAALPASGTVFIDNEQITYTGNDGANLTGCTRGANGTTAAAHADDAPIFYSPGGQNSGQRILTMRSEADLVPLGIPATVSSGGSAEWNYDGYWHYRTSSPLGWSGTRAALRGGDWGSGAYAGVFALYLSLVPSALSSHFGFRACKSI